MVVLWGLLLVQHVCICPAMGCERLRKNSLGVNVAAALQRVRRHDAI